MSGDGDSTRRMVDTMILVYATKASANTKDPEIKERRATSISVLTNLKLVNISAITWMEYLRGQTPEQAKALEPFRDKLFAHAVDPKIAAYAADLMRKYRASGVCPTCLNSKKSHQCTACGAKRSQFVRLNDAIILATAQLSADIDRLYTFDGGLLELASHIPGSKAEIPPHPSGDLFDAKVNPALSKSSKTGAVISFGPGLAAVPQEPDEDDQT